jgi:hypothetical protein
MEKRAKKIAECWHNGYFRTSDLQIPTKNYELQKYKIIICEETITKLKKPFAAIVSSWGEGSYDITMAAEYVIYALNIYQKRAYLQNIEYYDILLPHKLSEVGTAFHNKGVQSPVYTKPLINFFLHHSKNLDYVCYTSPYHYSREIFSTHLPNSISDVAGSQDGTMLAIIDNKGKILIHELFPLMYATLKTTLTTSAFSDVTFLHKE